jgi:cobalt/nickel transport system permease protein
MHGGAVSAAGAAVSAAACGVALARARRTLGERQVPLLGVTAAFVFAAQMLNFPIAACTSGHFLGAALAAILLGPLNAVLVMAVVLVIQCLLFGDGGVMALGCNIFNMGVVGPIAGYGVFRTLLAVVGNNRRFLPAAAAVAAWFSVVLAAAACAGELALAGTLPLGLGLPAMAGVHALIGGGEAIITAAAVSLILAVRPDLLACPVPAPQPAAKAAP